MKAGTWKLNVATIAVVLVLSGAFLLGLLAPGLKELSAARAELTRKVDTVAAAQHQANNLTELYQSILELRERQKEHRRRLPADRQIGEFLKDLSENLKKCGIDDYTVQPRRPQILEPAALPAEQQLVAGTTVLRVGVSFVATFPQTFEFLRGMQQQPRLFHVEMLHLAGAADARGRLEVEMVLNTYHRPD